MKSMGSLLMAGIFVLGIALDAWTEDRASSNPLDAAEVAGLVGKLGAEDFTIRDEAEKRLFLAGKPVADALKKALSSEDPEVRLRVRRILDRLFPVLQLQVRAAGEAKVGRTVSFEIRIKNVSDREQVVVRCLDGSTDGSRFPMYARQIEWAEKTEGATAEAKDGGRLCGNCNSLDEDDCVLLKPGETLDPFATHGHGQGGFGKWLLEWKPEQAGKASARFTCDFTPENPAFWNGPVERAYGLGKAEPLLARVPKLKLEAHVDLEVKP